MKPFSDSCGRCLGTINELNVTKTLFWPVWLKGHSVHGQRGQGWQRHQIERGDGEPSQQDE